MKKLYLLLAFFHSVSVLVLHAQLTCDFTFPNAPRACAPYVLHVEAINVPPSSVAERRWQLSLSSATIYSINNGGLNPYFNYIFPSAGTYSLRLWSSNINGDTCSITKTITINAKPTINFTFGPQLEGCSGLCVQAQCNITPGSGVIDSLAIDWGCGPIYYTNSCPSSPITHCYNCPPGCYDIVVVAFNSSGCYADTIYRDKVCIIPSPVACFASDTTASYCASSPLNVNFAACYAGPNMTYCWYINGPMVQCGSGRFLNHTFPPDVDCYDVKLVVTHPSGCADSIIKYDNICNRTIPQICFTKNADTACIDAQNPFHLSLTNCTAGLQDLTWSISGPCGNYPVVTGPTAAYTLSCTGCYIITASGSFGPGCSATLRDTLCAFALPPVVGFSVNDSFSCRLPFTVCYRADSCAGCMYSWHIAGALPTSNPPPSSNPVYCVTFTSPIGLHHFSSLDVTAPNGCTIHITKFDDVVFREINPVIGLNHGSGCGSLCVSFSDQTPYTAIPDSIISRCWSFSGPAIITDTCGSNAYRCFATPGCYDVKLKVATNTGCIDSITLADTVCVGSPPVCTFNAFPLSMCFEAEPVVISMTCDSFDYVLAIWGDGDTSTFYTQVFEHFYQDTGCMTTILIPYRDSCAGNVMSFTVCVNPPFAKFSDSSLCTTGDTVFLRNESGGATRYKWYFCNGDSSTTVNPFVVLPRCDTCTIRLIAYNDSFGCAHQTTRLVYTACSTASIFPSDTNLCGPAYIFFRNTSSSISPIPYTEWDFDTANGIIFQGPPLNFRTAVYNNAGIYVVAMRNLSTSGCIDTAYAHVRVCRPVADFTSANTCFPNPICFSNHSTDSFCALTFLRWDFGDGTIDSTSQNPCHHYSQPGPYQVQLTVVNDLGCISRITRTVVVSDVVILNISVDSLMCPTGNQHCIVNNSVGNNLSFQWFIPNALPNDTFTSASPCYTIPGVGDYMIHVIVESNNNCTVIDSFPVHVCVPEVSGSVSPDYLPCLNPPRLVELIANISCFDSIAIWSLGDTIYSNLDTVFHLFSQVETIPICLTAITRDGCAVTKCIDTIFISGPRLDTFSIFPLIACACQDTVTISLSTVGASAVTFLYGCGINGTYVNPVIPIGTPSTPTILSFSFPYCLTDSCQPQISLTDSFGCTVYYGLPFIYIDSPEVNFTYNAHGACVSGTVCFEESTNYSLPQSHSVMWYWDFGDGSIDTIQNPCHFYSGPGVYDVLLRIISNAGCIDSIFKQINIHGYPVAGFGFGITDSCNAATLCFSDSSSADTGGVIVKWRWCYGDGLCDSSGANPCHVYFAETNYPVSLIVEDESGCSDTSTANVIISGIDFLSAQIGTLSITDSCTYIKVCLIDSGVSEFSILSYSWNLNGTLSDSGQPCFRIYDSGAQHFGLHITDIHSCEASDSTAITTSLNQLNALFTFSGNNNGLVQFMNISTGAYVSASWNINGVISGSANPVYQFTASGNYSVSLSISDAQGCTDDTTINISVIISSANNLYNEVELKIVPNPFHEFTTIQITGVEGTIDFRLMNLIGEEVMMKRLIKNEIVYLYRENLSTGLYLYEIVSKRKSIKRGKLMVE